jgi:hypothetical protein
MTDKKPLSPVWSDRPKKILERRIVGDRLDQIHDQAFGQGKQPRADEGDEGDQFTPVGPDAEMIARRLSPTRGPVTKFVGRIIAEATSHKQGKQRWQECRLWETKGGALIAELVGASDAGTERDITTLTVVEPNQDGGRDMFAVMEGFEWNTLARAMVRDQLGWKLERIVE